MANWTSEEENALLEMGDSPDYQINRGNNADWDTIATDLNGRFHNRRTAKACEERWRLLDRKRD